MLYISQFNINEFLNNIFHKVQLIHKIKEIKTVRKKDFLKMFSNHKNSKKIVGTKHSEVFYNTTFKIKALISGYVL